MPSADPPACFRYGSLLNRRFTLAGLAILITLNWTSRVARFHVISVKRISLPFSIFHAIIRTGWAVSSVGESATLTS